MEKSVNLEVPTSGEANQSVDSSAVQTIGIDRENVITLNDEIVDLSTLESRLISLHEEKPEAPVIIRPDKSLTVQQLVSVMDVLQRAKISKVGVATRSEQSE